jgi:hypothetical protein
LHVLCSAKGDEDRGGRRHIHKPQLSNGGHWGGERQLGSILHRLHSYKREAVICRHQILCSLEPGSRSMLQCDKHARCVTATKHSRGATMSSCFDDLMRKYSSSSCAAQRGRPQTGGLSVRTVGSQDIGSCIATGGSTWGSTSRTSIRAAAASLVAAAACKAVVAVCRQTRTL